MGVLGFHMQLRLDLCGPLPPPPALCMRIICFPLFVYPKEKHAYVVCVRMCPSLHIAVSAFLYI